MFGRTRADGRPLAWRTSLIGSSIGSRGARMRACLYVVVAAAVAGILLCAPAAWPQDVTESALKAGFVYNFAKFTDWPADALPPGATITACVLGDTAVGEALARGVKGRPLDGRAIAVSQIEIKGPLRSCHLLYVSGVDSAHIRAIVATVEGAPVLTIGDFDDFVGLGGIARVFDDTGRMRFDLNLVSARRSRLQLSSKLVALASHVFGGPGGKLP